MTNSEKITWQGEVLSIQPRIRLLRSFDQRSHQYLGYALHIQGDIGGDDRCFWIGIGKVAQAKQQLQAGCVICGECLPIENQRIEIVEFYKVSKLRLLKPSSITDNSPPP